MDENVLENQETNAGISYVKNINKSAVGARIEVTAADLPGILLRYVNQLKLSGRSNHTISAYRNDLTLFCEFLTEFQVSPGTFSFQHQDHWVHFLKKNGKKSEASLRRSQMSVRSFLHYLLMENHIAVAPYLDTKSLKQPQNSLLVVTDEKMNTLSNFLYGRAQGGDSKAVRDYALILILGECGLKVSEVSRLTWGDVWPDVQNNVGGKGKHCGCLRVGGAQERLVPYSDQLSTALQNLKKVRGEMGLKTDPESSLFFGYLNVSRQVLKENLHRHGIKFVIYEVCVEVLGVPFHSESFRNHAIMRWIAQGINMEQVAELAGYNSLTSLERFVSGKEKKQKSDRKI